LLRRSVGAFVIEDEAKARTRPRARCWCARAASAAPPGRRAHRPPRPRQR
jgi:hypothetical protein